FPAAFASSRLRFQLVLHDLSVQSAPADAEHPGRLLLVPVHEFEHPDDVGALGLGQRWEAIPRWLQDRRRRVKKFDVAPADGPSWRRQGRSRNRAFELTDVARPVVADQEIERLS